MRYTYLLAALMFTANLSWAQAPADDALQRGQRRTSAAYSELQSAEYETKRVEQEHRQADADYKAAQKRADEIKQAASAAQKKLEAAVPSCLCRLR